MDTLSATGDGGRMGVPHQKALIGLCQAVGMSTNALGTTRVVGNDGSSIDCTGTIQGMLS